MLLTTQTWEKIRHLFSQEEKDALNKAITGEVICPRGAVLDEEKLGAALKEKICSAATPK